ncbi:cobalamin biosynthesis protein [Luteimonas vadosa]|uniref:Membrane protein n=1 Tax=Luteimonas vadosa TaxID=1165507 RepID=A0ABP9DX13_9GAMM
MFATLLAVLVALVLGHLAHSLAVAVRNYAWFDGWLAWLDAKFPEDGFWRGRYGIVLALLPPLLAVGLFQAALDGPMYGLPALLFGVAALFYAWGPRDLDHDVEAIVDAPDDGSRRAAAARLWPSARQVPNVDGPAAVEAVFNNALRRWFGVLFWFLLLGPFGALLYRLAAIAAEEAAPRLPAGTAEGARTLLVALDWPVAQLMTLSMALVGNFDVVASAWKRNGGDAFALDTGFLAAAGRASVRSEIADEAEEYTESGVPASSALLAELGPLPELRDAMSLVWRILLVWLAVLALFVVAGWVS